MSHPGSTPPPAADRPVIVMKFGGTSVGDADGRAAIAERVAASISSGNAPVVVVSAMGRSGAPYATDTLLGLVADLPHDLREHDLLMATGEIIASVVLAHELRHAGIDAAAFTGAEAGIATEGTHGEATVAEVHTGALVSAIQSGTVPVVTGFQGVDAHGKLTTLGRGGSDTTACALGVALGAREVEIYTDVDGVMSTDPRECDDASVLTRIRADELFQMARHGARVVHTPAAELALASGLTVRVRNTFSDHPGTAVVDVASYRPAEVATAVTRIDGIARVTVSIPAQEGTPEHMAAQAQIYRAMADSSISLDMFSPAGETLVFSVAEESVPAARQVLDVLALPHRVKEGLSKVTLVGAGMHGVPGVMARMSEYLADAKVTVLQTADSHTTISVLVPSATAHDAVKALHKGFSLGE